MWIANEWVQRMWWWGVWCVGLCVCVREIGWGRLGGVWVSLLWCLGCLRQ